MRRALVVVVFATLVTACPGKKDGGDPGGECAPGDSRPCYDGPAGTEGVGTCAAGVSTCGADRMWGACAGAVLPAADVCGNGLNDDCVANADDIPDLSRFELTGNSIDDDCDGDLDEATTCDRGLPSNPLDPLDYAKAVDMCAVTTTSATGTFGVTSSTFSLLDGSGSADADARSIRTNFGTNTNPQAGSSLIVLSTGNASYVGATNPSFIGPQSPSANHGITSPFPPDWLALNGGAVPSVSTCPAPSGTVANDPILYTLQLRVPTNARAIAFDAFYYSPEFPEYVCTAFGDVFVALLDSTATANPADKNIARTDGHPVVSSNLAVGDTGYFQQCLNGDTGCSGAVPGTITTCVGTDLLAGTGLDLDDTGCGGGDDIGGGTGWLTFAGNVTPGELATVRFAIWDSSDAAFDSTVLIDNVRWLEDAVIPGVQ